MAPALPEPLTFRNQLDALSAKFVADYRRGDSIACTDAFTKDGLLLLPNVAPIRGRTEIAAALTASMDGGLQVSGITTKESGADEKYGYAIQTVHTSRGDQIVMLALRCDHGIWRVCAEAVMAS